MLVICFRLPELKYNTLVYAILEVMIGPHNNFSMSAIPFNPIPHGVWNIRYYTGGAIMAQVFLRSHRFTQRPPTTLNLLPDKYFDLWLSIDTKNSPLCGILLRLRAVKWRWSKMKFFKPKKVEISKFELQKCCVIYLKRKLRTYLNNYFSGHVCPSIVRPWVRGSVRHKIFFSLKSPWNHPLTPGVNPGGRPQESGGDSRAI